MMETRFGGPMRYDPTSENEKEVPLPSEPQVILAPNVIMQPPLTRLGFGPSLVLLLPNVSGPPAITDATPTTAQIDPEPVQKWAEEGFCVMAIYATKGQEEEWSFEKALEEGLPLLKSWHNTNDLGAVTDKVAMIIYDHSILPASLPSLNLPVQVLVSFALDTSSRVTPHPTIPTLLQTCSSSFAPSAPAVAGRHRSYVYENQGDSCFCIPGSHGYTYNQASIAHARSLSWIKTKMNGPWFDLEALWEEHTGHEFFTRSVAKTMSTMVAEPYVNHIPTITGGVGRKSLTAFYRDHFIFSNPRDTVQTMVSRCVGLDRIAEEFTFSFTHDQMVDWLLPGVPPTGKRVDVPMNAFVSIRGDRLYHEHISWDQATVYRQVGLLPTHTAFQNKDMSESKLLRLPTSDGTDASKMLVAVGAVKSNQMFDWGIEE